MTESDGSPAEVKETDVGEVPQEETLISEELRETHKKVYRSKFLPGFLLSIGLCGIMELLFNYFKHGHSLQQIALGILFIIVFVGIVVLFYTVTITAEGIRAYSWYGLFRSYKWQDISSVKPINIPLLKYIRIIPVKGVPVWVPLFLRGYESFCKDVEAYVQNPEHPLVKVLAAQGTAVVEEVTLHDEAGQEQKE